MNPYIQYMYSYPHKTAYGPLADVNLRDHAQKLQGTGHGFYLHIPFCQSKCGYCNLFSVTGAGGEDMDRYLDAVERQLRQYRQILDRVKCRFSDFTIGGGTPLLLSERQLDRVFSITDSFVRFEDKHSIVIETAPDQTDKEKLKLLKRAGVTRVSMGIQSFSEDELKALRRRHSGAKARESLKLLMSFGFPLVNIDFIYGIPGQTTASLLSSLREAVSYEPGEIFLYPLYVKHGARLEREGAVPEPERAYAQYREAADFLKAQGFRQDSMRRFVRPASGKEQESVREFSDCGFGTSLAVGCGGRSYLGNLHFCTPYAITRTDCLKELKDFEETEDFTKITHGIWLSEEEQKRRYVIRHLLIRPGLDEHRYRESFGNNVLEDFPVIRQWMEEGFASAGGDGYIVLTDRGLGFSDYLGPRLISDNVRKRMEEWEDIRRHGSRPHDPLQRKLKEL